MITSLIARCGTVFDDTYHTQRLTELLFTSIPYFPLLCKTIFFMAHNFVNLCILKTKLSHAKYLPQTYFVLIKAKGFSNFQV